MWRHDAPGERDYFGGFSDVVGEFDGTPGVEIVAIGHRRMYLYDGATGQLEGTSADLGLVPYARATVLPVDLEGDGVSELFVFSNEAWAPPNNRRYVALMSWQDAANAITEVWSREVADVVNDRVAYAPDSLTDLDGDGLLEVVFGVYDAAKGSWSTEIRDAGSGVLLDSVIGERFEAGLQEADGSGGVFFTADHGAPLRMYRFNRSDGGAGQLLELGAWRVARCRLQTTTTLRVLTGAPCFVPGTNGPASVMLAQEAGIARRLVRLRRVGLSSGGAIAEYEAPELGFITSLWQAQGDGPGAIAVAHTRGVVRVLNPRLAVPTPTTNPPYAWSGIFFGSRFSGTDLPPFPLVAGCRSSRCL
jgi:hypothetical protein